MMEPFFFTDDHRAFICSIERAPNDDAPRLVYADYLEEQDEYAAAEYLRLVVKLYRTGDSEPELGRLCSLASKINGTWREQVAAIWDIDINAADLGLRFIAEAFSRLFGGKMRQGLNQEETGKSVCFRRGVTREEAQSVVEMFSSMPLISSNIYHIRFTVRPQWQENDWGKPESTEKRRANAS